MAIQHKNRKGDTYYLHQGKTKTGKPKYFFSKKTEGVLVDAIPDGYEIHENPHGQVFLRKAQPRIISDEEMSVVQQCLKRCKHIRHWQVEVKKNSIVVYTAEDTFGEYAEVFGPFPVRLDRRAVSRIMERSLQYLPMLRFTLENENEKERGFVVARWRFSGSEGWMFLECSDDLAALAAKYCPALETDKFYELY